MQNLTRWRAGQKSLGFDMKPGNYKVSGGKVHCWDGHEYFMAHLRMAKYACGVDHADKDEHTSADVTCKRCERIVAPNVEVS